MSYIDRLISERLGGINFGLDTTTYKFEKIKRAKAQLKKRNPEVKLIDMGVGEPDSAADKKVVKILSIESGKVENRYYADNGILEFKVSACKYLESVYKVKGLDPERNIIHGIGSKPILAMIPICIINPGDYVLMTTPGYPILGTYTKYLGGKVYDLELKEENNFFPDLNNIPEEILKKAKILYINYPNNPTGQTATEEFFKEVVQFAKKNEILVVHDAAYAAVTFDGYEPLSFLSVEGAIDVGVEIHSLSKAFNMTGWRLAFIAGNEKVVKAYGAVKDNTDSGQFRAIQKAGIYAMEHTDITKKTCEKYSRRFDLLVKALEEVGFTAKKPKGTFYCYVKAPIGAGNIRFENAEEAAEFLIINAAISTVPWDEVGAYLRFSVTFEVLEETEEDIINEVKDRLKALKLVF